MPTKSVKKTATKPATAKKTTVKKVATKKPVSKTAKKAAPVMDAAAIAPAPEMVARPVDTKCPCGDGCKCGNECKCARGGSKFVRFMMKLIFALIIFALGFAAARLVDDGRDFRGPRVDFDNGCLVVSSVKCPQLQALLPVMDMDQDGCITREEFRAVDAELRRQMRAASADAPENMQ